MGATPPMTDTALEYHRRGLAVIPTSGKKARFDWKQFQRERPIEGMLHDWFGRLSEGTTGLAVVLGKVSGMLAVRDFDQSDAYDGWAKSHPNLADTLPTVTTARGRHVYFRTRKEMFADLPDGELRGDSKHYVLVPPSLHPSGVIYRWTIPLPEGPLPVLDPRKAGFLDAATCNTASTGNKEGAVPAVSAVLHGLPVGAGEAVAGTLPVGAGERNRRLFDLARRLKSLPHLADCDPLSLEVVVRRWHGLTRPVIRTKEWDDTWLDFLVAWERVQFPVGQGPVEALFRQACLAPLPPAAAGFERPEVKQLIGLCAALQGHAGDSPFFLACRTAGGVLGVNYVQAWRWLGYLERTKVLRRISTGRLVTHKANEYRFTGG